MEHKKELIENTERDLERDVEEDTRIEETGSDFKIPSHHLSIMNQDVNVETLIKWIKSGKIIFPDFQRGLVWDKNKEEDLIDSILIRIPIPSLTFIKVENEGNYYYEVIDGMQRLSTINKFINPSKNDSGPKIKYQKKVFESLDNSQKEDIKDYSFNISFFSLSTEKYGKNTKGILDNIKYQIFKKINKGSVDLTPQEVRNAIYMCPNLKKIVEITKNDIFFNLVKEDNRYNHNKPRNRKVQDEFLIRLLSYSYWYFNNEKINFKSKKEDFLNNFMENVKNNEINISELLNNSLKILEKIDDKSFYSLRANKDYKIESSSIMETFSEALFIYFQILIENNKVIPDRGSIFSVKKEIFMQYHQNTNKIRYKEFFQNTVNQESVVKRVEVLQELFNIK